MPRYEGPVRFRFDGDPELARQYIYAGRNLLGEVREQMERSGIAQLSRTVRNQDGTHIKVYSGYGENTVEIFREEVEAPPEPKLVGNFVTTPASEEAPAGWGDPFFDEEGTPINPPLGTPGGGGSQTLLSWLNPGWKTRRYWQYQDFWPDDIAFGNNAWAGKDVNSNDIVLSWQSAQRYRDWGYIFFTKTIYHNGFALCNTKQYVIGAAVVGGNLVALSATPYQTERLATWHFRPFKPGGYNNDGDYNEETNPDGWRECGGDSQEIFAREDARQPLSFTLDGKKAALSYVVSRADNTSNRDFIYSINVVTFNITSGPGQVTIIRMTEADPYLLGINPYVSNFSHIRDEDSEKPGLQERDEGETPGVPASPDVYHEYDFFGNLVGFGVASGAGSFLDRTDWGPGVITERKRLIYTNVRLGPENFVFYSRDSHTLEEITLYYNEKHTVFIDGNISLGYFLGFIFNPELFPAVGRTKAVLIGPGIGTLELFDYEGTPPVPYYVTSPGIYNPSHSIFDDDFTDSTVYSSNDISMNLGRSLGKPEPIDIDAGLSFDFAAHYNAANQKIVTAWMRFDRGTEVLFGAYNFITDGNLPGLTQVQGTNQRHQNTGVI